MSEKKRKILKDTEIMTSRLYKKNVIHETFLIWRISNYEDLRYDVMYFQLYEKVNLKCVLSLFKDSETLHLIVTADSIFKETKADFSILNEVNNQSVTQKANHINDGIFVGIFSNKEFLFPDSNFLSNGVLTISFKYISDYYVINRETPLKIVEVLSDFDELCYDYKKMYLDEIFPDFFIHVRDYTFKSHKVILTARSKYFFRLLEFDKKKKDHRLPDDVKPGILHQVLQYMYCGELMEMNEDCMLEVYKLAVDLDVSRLCSRCLEYLKNRINLDNYMKFCKFASEMKLKELKNLIIHVADKKFPGILFNVLGAFKQIDEKSVIVSVIKKKT